MFIYNSKIFKVLFLVVILSLSVMKISYARNDLETIKLLDLFGSVFDKVRSDYVEKVSDKELVESAINGMLSSLDPHSSYLNKKDFDVMKEQTYGEFSGLGIEVTMEKGLVKVISPIDDTPAYKAGIKAGDYISQINGEPVMGKTLDTAVEKMRGRSGTSVSLEILRKGEDKPIKFTIVRDIIKIKSVKVHQEGNDIAYVRVISFTEKVSKTIRKEVYKMKKEMGKNFKGLILDLRNNPGGLLDEAVDVADLFLSQGEIVSTQGRISNSKKRFYAKRGDIIDKKLIVVLINVGSASASEIVSGALQDHRRAIIMGEKSFGKGSVQTVIPLAASSGAMRLTTSRYYTPSGNSIQAKGINPDIVVKQSKVEPLNNRANIPNEASLPKHLENNITSEKKKYNSEKSQQKLYESDYQLGRAVDLIRAIYLYNQNSKI